MRAKVVSKKTPYAIIRLFAWLWAHREGAQIVELAVTVPLLAAMFVATYDFGQAFNLRQKLVAATREAARFAANETTADLTSTSSIPASIFSIRDMLDSYLVANNINDCGLGGLTSASRANWRWTFTARTCAAGTFSVTINRGFTYPATTASTTGNVPLTVEATQVTIDYPYQWQFTRVVQFLVPHPNYAPVAHIATSAVVQNLN